MNLSRAYIHGWEKRSRCLCLRKDLVNKMYMDEDAFTSSMGSSSNALGLYTEIDGQDVTSAEFKTRKRICLVPPTHPFAAIALEVRSLKQTQQKYSTSHEIGSPHYSASSSSNTLGEHESLWPPPVFQANAYDISQTITCKCHPYRNKMRPSIGQVHGHIAYGTHTALTLMTQWCRPLFRKTARRMDFGLISLLYHHPLRSISIICWSWYEKKSFIMHHLVFVILASNTARRAYTEAAVILMDSFAIRVTQV